MVSGLFAGEGVKGDGKLMKNLKMDDVLGKTIAAIGCDGFIFVLKFSDSTFLAMQSNMLGGLSYIDCEYDLATNRVPKVLIDTGMVQQSDIDAAKAERAAKVAKYNELKAELGL